MSEATATKPIKTTKEAVAPVPTLSTPRENKLRAVQIKKFQPSSLKALGYGDTEILTATAPAGMSFAEVMLPVAWNNVSGLVAKDPLNTRNERDGVGCVIILDTADNSFHAWLRVNKVVRDHLNNPCGFDLVCIGPTIDVKTGKACPIDVKTGLPWVDPAADTVA